MVTFIIWAPPYGNDSGGKLALHKLAKMIADEGERVIITSSTTMPNSKAEVCELQVCPNFDPETTMIIYPEIISGNPYNGKYVTRWLLYTVASSIEETWAETDLYYQYWEYFKSLNDSRVRGTLTTLDLKTDVFYDKGFARHGESFIIKKGQHKKLDQHVPNSINIDFYLNDEYLVQLFNECERFISYDSMCYHSIQAALCGCTSIIIPDEGVTREEFFKKAPINQYGVAYGFDDIERAKQTQPLLRKYLLELEQTSISQVKDFIKDCYAHMNIQMPNQ
jgi:hypothetical protein